MVDLKRQAELRDAIEGMFFSYRAFTEGPDRILERRGLGRVHHRILYFVGRHPDISIKGLLDLLKVTKQALNAPLRQLIEMNLLTASANAVDRRVRNLRLTDEGRRLEAELTGAQMRHLEAALSHASPEAEAGWREVMAALIHPDA
jgi:DNA-binding MarR family transcriptional regulator